MATFKVGDRVRVVAVDVSHQNYLVGKTGVITGRGEHWIYLWSVDLDNGPKAAFNREHLAPILPPQADEWAADKVKQVTKPTYLEPERVKEKA